MKKRAVFVGVNKYDDPQIRNLRFSRQDAHSLCELFADVGYESTCLLDPARDEVVAAVKKATSGLTSGDVFLFYFAGHGFAYGGCDLLFCRESSYKLLKGNGDTGLKLDSIRLLTEGDGVTAPFDRLFILDACRSDFLAGTRGEEIRTRDLSPAKVMVRSESKRGVFAVMHSCSAGQCALEVDSAAHGLFTCALLAVIKLAHRAGSRIAFDDTFGDEVAKKMAAIAREANLLAEQTPDFSKSIGGGAIVLVEGCENVPAVDKLKLPLPENVQDSNKNHGIRPKKEPLNQSQTVCPLSTDIFLEYNVLRDYRSMLRNCGMDDAINKMNNFVRYIRSRNVWHVTRIDAFLKLIESMPAFADVVQEKNMARASRHNLKCWFDNKGWSDTTRLENIRTYYGDAGFTILNAIYDSITRSNLEN